MISELNLPFSAADQLVYQLYKQYVKVQMWLKNLSLVKQNVYQL